VVACNQTALVPEPHPLNGSKVFFDEIIYVKTGTDASPSEFPPQSVLICRRLAKKARHIGTYALTAVLVGSSCPTPHFSLLTKNVKRHKNHNTSCLQPATCHTTRHTATLQTASSLKLQLDIGHETLGNASPGVTCDPSSMTGAVDIKIHFLNSSKKRDQQSILHP
jgi:hypothetical protein